MIFDLSRMETIFKLLGSPEGEFPAIHVAGTNGKGSVCSFLFHVLKESGFKVGLYTSPHLESIHERFRINDSTISQGDLNSITNKIKRSLQSKKSPIKSLTQFEFLTAVALVWFSQQKIDIAVIEVGLGGRLDATNTLKNVLVSVITNIDYDHMDWLGSTLKEIAFEKAGIIKQSIPVVTGAQGVALKTIRSVSHQRRSPVDIVPIPKRNPFSFDWDQLPLKGRHQKHNAAIALKTIQVLIKKLPKSKLLNLNPRKITAKSIQRGFLKTTWPGRFEVFHIPFGRIRRTFILDGAHNPAAMDVLLATLRDQNIHKVNLLFGVLKDKNFDLMISKLSSIVLQCVSVPVPSPRGLKPQIVARNPLWKKMAQPASSIKSGLEIIEEFDPAIPVLVTGSLYLIGIVRTILSRRGEPVARPYKR